MPGRVLVVEDSATNRKLIRLRLSATYYDVMEAADGQEALELAAAEYPDLILLDVVMPGMDGFEVCRRLRLDGATAHIPIVMLTALDGRADRMRGLEAGADDFLSKPFDDLALLSRVASLTRMKMMVDELALRGETAGTGISPTGSIAPATRFPDAHVLIVSASAAAAAPLQAAIGERIGCSVEIADPRPDPGAVIGRATLDAVIFDGDLAGADPLRLGSKVRARPQTRQAATLLIVDKGDKALAAKALEIGFSDYIASPVDPVELVARVRLQLRRKSYSDQLRETVRTSMVHAVTDPLTGLYNRRYANTHLDATVDRCRDRAADLTVMMLDLDRFKSINDRHGHAAGDRVLCEFARRLQDNVRGVDLVARVGGEEFMVVMPEAGARSAAEIAERIRVATAAAEFAISDAGETLPVTVSIGYAVMKPRESVFELIKRADQALYASKSAGRNRATLDAA